MLSKISASPTLVRVVPFAVFLGLTFLQDRFGEAGRYWIYLCKTVTGAFMLLAVHRYLTELEWRWSWESVVVGIGVFAIWVALDGHYPALDVFYHGSLCPFLKKFDVTTWCAAESTVARTPWNPHAAFGTNSLAANFFVISRILGSTLIVPAFEEVFYRSFLYRYLTHKDFLAMPLGRFSAGSFLITSLIFGFAHHEWLAGILCGFLYQALVIWKNRLGDAVTAHAITNFLLGLWVVWRGAWHFW